VSLPWFSLWSCGKWLFRFEPVRCTVSHPTYHPTTGRAETWASNKSSSSNDYGCAIFCSNSLLHWHVIRGYLVASSTIFLLLEYHPYLQLEIALYYNAIFS
jgi:hypothetical protein